ncbi:MAG TPA: hypothetical protein DCP92_17010 [Nitrospiraceae bacterium]|jgi:hypothetical protein|nr:hypothetical protein [Nitrospiraceae bacterium]
MRRISLVVVVLLLIIVGVVATIVHWGGHKNVVYIFPGVTGPSQPTTPPVRALPTSWENYAKGSSSRLAVLLTDVDSDWLGIAHGLKAIGIPFVITRAVSSALKHRVVLVYPLISGKVLDPDALRALANHPQQGGTLIGVNVLGGLNKVFGFDEAVAAHNHYEIRFDGSQRITAEFSDPRESTIRIASPTNAAAGGGAYSYSNPRTSPIAHFEDGTAAITMQSYVSGRAYAIGVDIGHLLLKGYNNREENIARSYVDEFEPSLDVLLRLIRNIYLEGENSAVTLGTVPFGRSLAVALTHDIDYTRSIENALVYGKLEKSQGVPATYFVQTKYVRDWNDDVFFNAHGVECMKALDASGFEIASHSVSHSRVFSKFPLGKGDETYPQYVPFVKDAKITKDGTVLGELRVSKFLIEHFLPGRIVDSFRPGHLQNPYSLPGSLVATGYRYSSSVTANNSLTHLPFQLNDNRETRAEAKMYEFPLTVEDEKPPKMIQRLPEAIDLARKISRYGGAFIILIHPDVLAEKFEFEREFIPAVKDFAWFGSIRDFGNWWSARDQIGVDVTASGNDRLVLLTVPKGISGLAVQVPPSFRFVSADPASVRVSVKEGMVVIKDAPGDLALRFRAKD